MCTTFATETQIRRCGPSERPGYKITVESEIAEDASLAQLFPIEYRNDDWDTVNSRLLDSIKEAFDGMRRRSDEEKAAATSDLVGIPQARLRNDIMTIKVEKPGQAHFSIVDIPGLVSSELFILPFVRMS